MTLVAGVLEAGVIGAGVLGAGVTGAGLKFGDGDGPNLCRVKK